MPQVLYKLTRKAKCVKLFYRAPSHFPASPLKTLNIWEVWHIDILKSSSHVDLEQ